MWLLACDGGASSTGVAFGADGACPVELVGGYSSERSEAVMDRMRAGELGSWGWGRKMKDVVFGPS